MTSRRRVLVAALIVFITICSISSYLLGAQASITSSPTPFASQAVGGRWQLVHASLGLKHLPVTVAASLPKAKSRLSRNVGFRNRKRASFIPLHFTPDALRKPRVSLKELVVSLRRNALEEARIDAMHAETKKGRSRPGKIPLRRGQFIASP